MILNVLVWMDDLMDSRLSVAASVDPLKALELVAKGYYNRISDQIIYDTLGISQAKWQQLYKNRNETHLVRASSTPMISILRELFVEINRQPRERANELNMTVTINTYPYYLPDEAREAWVEVLQELIHPLLKVKVIRREYKSLTRSTVLSNYTHLFHYDWDHWLTVTATEEHAPSLVGLNIFAPRLFRGHVAPEDQKTFAEMTKEVDLPEFISEVLSGEYTIKHLPISVWCPQERVRQSSDSTA